jgi:hypothetical protein
LKTDVAESSEEGCGPNMPILPVMMMMMMMMMVLIIEFK